MHPTYPEAMPMSIRVVWLFCLHGPESVCCVFAIVCSFLTCRYCSWYPTVPPNSSLFFWPAPNSLHSDSRVEMFLTPTTNATRLVSNNFDNLVSPMSELFNLQRHGPWTPKTNVHCVRRLPDGFPYEGVGGMKATRHFLHQTLDHH